MHPLHWMPAGSERVLDVGCNVGALLQGFAELNPFAQLAGVDVNAAAVTAARNRVPHADIQLVSGTRLPFPDDTFDCVTCIEVLEHIPSTARRSSLAEMCRVLAPGGQLIVRCPHAGLFAWLDVANLRHRFPDFYRKVIGRGLRDEAYPAGTEDIVWHQHFTVEELHALMPDNLSLEHLKFGGLFLFPLTDWLRWPFYRAHHTEHLVVRMLASVAEADYGIDYGRWSFGILMVLRKRI